MQLWNINPFQTKHATNHVGITTLFILLQLLWIIPHQVVAQSGGRTSSPPPEDQYLSDNTLKVSPGMAILLVGLVTTFFMMGCVSVYARRCIEAWSGSTQGGGLPLRDINRRSGRTRHGIDPNVIDTFPIFLYSDVKGLKIGKVELECAVCLSEFEDDANLRLLPKCCHVFHAECIDTWLASHVTCPVCRADLVPVSGEEAINTCNLQRTDSVSDSTQLTRSPEVRGAQGNEIGELIIDISSINSPEVTNPVQSPIPNRNTIATVKSPPVLWRFLRSHSTGHSLAQPGQDYERFTLRLPEGVQEMLKKPELRRVVSHAVLQTERSPKRWFRRSTSVGTGRGRNNNVYYERFDREARPDRWGFSITPPFVARSKSIQSQPTEVSNKINITSSGSLIKTAVKSPFDRLFSSAERDDDVGERSFARLTGNNPV